MHKRILTIFLIIMFVVVGLNAHNVFGHDVVSQAWKTDVDGKPYLLFRVYTTPHADAVEKYYKTRSEDKVDNGILKYEYNGKLYTSKWVYTYNNNNNVLNPKTSQFSTIAYAFHKDTLTEYVESKKSNDSSVIGYNTTDVKIDYNINTLTKAYNESKAEYAVLTNKISDRTLYNDAIFCSILRNGGTYSTMRDGTQINVKNLYSETPLEYRHSIVQINKKNVYVGDNMIFGDNLEEFVRKAKANGCENSCYISQITISRMYGNSKPTKYEVSVTAKDFYLQDGKTWSKSVKGKAANDDKAMGSAVNLYDNILEFPQLTNRTVLVRHINIGNNKSVSVESVNNAQNRIDVSKFADKLTLLAGERNLDAATSTTNTTYVGKYEEYYDHSIDIEDKITKLALPDVENKYKYIGYNVGVALDERSALDIVNNRIKAEQCSEGKQVIIPAKTVSSDSDYIVIDFYYSEYDTEVDVNHLYINEVTGTVMDITKQTIVPNQIAIMNGNEITRNNKDDYVKETYSRKLGATVIANRAISLEKEIVSGEIKYLGYETLTEKIGLTDLIGKKINLNGLSGKDKTIASLESNKVQVNFYYFVTKEQPDIDKEDVIEVIREPDRNVGGELIIKSTRNERHM